MNRKILAVLSEKGGYWAWTNTEIESLRPSQDLCLNCQGTACGESDGCHIEDRLMEMCSAHDLRVAVSRCPVWQPSARSSVTAEQQQHYGLMVWVSPALETVRRDQCLCLNCQRCQPGQRGHCFMAEGLYRLCCRGGLAMVISRCPQWTPKE